jgi:hypothetical protein
MSWLFSRALVEEYSEAICSDGEQFVPLNGNPIPQAYCAPDKMMAFSYLSQFGMTFKPLMESHGEALLMSYLAAFRAKIFHPRGGGQALMENVAVCGEKWHASLGKYNPDTSSWKTHQCSLLGDLEEFSETWPRWGLMRNGEFWEVKNLAHHIQGTEFGLSHPTPLKTDHFKFLRFRKESVLKSTFGMHRNSIAYWMTANHGKIPSAEWIYWVMGWPNGWANLNALETDKYQSWLQRHGESSVVIQKKEFND